MTGVPGALSVCMIVKNEAANLLSCLSSVRALASEFIVVDTGSTDGTPKIAAEYSAQVIPFDFQRVDFAGARNEGLARARGRWILVLDADEWLDPASVPPLAEIISTSKNIGYVLERQNHLPAPELPRRDYVVRLFPNRPDYRYRGRVHETVDASILSGGGRLETTNILIHHSFCSDPEARRRKNRWYIEILKEEIAADPTDDSRLDFLAAEYHQLEMFDEAAAVSERIVRMRPSDPRAHLFFGVYQLLYKSDLVRARAAFQEALRLRPGYSEAESFLRKLEERERATSVSRAETLHSVIG